MISARRVGPAIGFELFAMLSIVRLRSEPIGNAELAHFFCALVLALVNGLPLTTSCWSSDSTSSCC